MSDNLHDSIPANPAFATRVVQGDQVAISGDRGRAVTGASGSSTSGAQGTSITGDFGYAKAGDHGHAIAGDAGVAVSGVGGISVTGVSGLARAGVGGTIVIAGARNGARYTVAADIDDVAGPFADTMYRLHDHLLIPVNFEPCGEVKAV